MSTWGRTLVALLLLAGCLSVEGEHNGWGSWADKWAGRGDAVGAHPVQHWLHGMMRTLGSRAIPSDGEGAGKGRMLAGNATGNATQGGGVDMHKVAWGDKIKFSEQDFNDAVGTYIEDHRDDVKQTVSAIIWGGFFCPRCHCNFPLRRNQAGDGNAGERCPDRSRQARGGRVHEAQGEQVDRAAVVHGGGGCSDVCCVDAGASQGLCAHLRPPRNDALRVRGLHRPRCVWVLHNHPHLGNVPRRPLLVLHAPLDRGRAPCALIAGELRCRHRGGGQCLRVDRLLGACGIRVVHLGGAACRRKAEKRP
mmetsp:Transcript_10086/g.23587  ORF Transcript_10086/g.23587 Transcript_10086/m.23587 type:complete len:307 (-) Transcript_10086:239-1159(-)